MARLHGDPGARLTIGDLVPGAIRGSKAQRSSGIGSAFGARRRRLLFKSSWVEGLDCSLSSKTPNKGTLTWATLHEAFAGQDELRYTGFTPQ